MGEEEEKKALEEKEIVDDKKESSGGEGEKREAEGEVKVDHPPTPPEEVVMKVYMHCVACARKVSRCLRRIDGVESVVANSRDHIVVVKGKKAAGNPMRMVERVQRKCRRKVELIRPIAAPEPEKKGEINLVEPTPAVVEPQVITVVLRVYMHCEACSKEIKKRILELKGVQEVELDLNSHEVAVNGVFDPEKLAEYVRKRTGKHAVVLKKELPPPPSEQKAEEEKKAEGVEKTLNKSKGELEKGDGNEEKKKQDAGEEKKAKEKDKQTGAEDATHGAPSAVIADSGAKVAGAMKKYNYYPYHPMYTMEHSYPPQIFSDENPNACTVM